MLVGTGIGTLLLLAAVTWLLVSGLKARTQLEAVRAQVRQLRAEIAAGDLSSARRTAAQLHTHAERAHALTTGPVWSTAAALPYFGDPAQTVRAITSGVDKVANSALPQLIDASRQLEPGTVRRRDGSLALGPIEKAAPDLERATRTLRAARRQIENSPSSTWLGTVDTARSDLAGQLHSLASTLLSADVAARTLPTLFGGHGPKSYFVSFQNEAELRGLGGLPGAFAILKADRGKLSFTRFESDSAIMHVDSGLNFDAGFQRLYSRRGSDRVFDPTRLYVNSDDSPHFPYAAQIWLAQWERKTGQRLDGAITLDPTAVSYLLGVAGPTRLADGTLVTAGNVVALTQQAAYDRFARDNSARKVYLLDIARAVSSRLIAATANTSAIVRAAAKAVGEHRLLVYSTDRAVEKQLQRTAISGVVPRTDSPYVGLALINDMTGKLDYYLSATLDWRRTGCGPTRTVTVTMTLTNHGRAALPDYVVGRYGKPGHPKHRGDNQQVVDYFATTGALLTSVDINGRPAGASIAMLQSHPVYRVLLPLPHGVLQRIVLHLREPAGSGGPVVRAQPMIRPLRVSLDDARCD